MNMLYLLGSIGGILILIENLIDLVKLIIEKSKENKKYKMFYNEHKEDEEVTLPIGFHTEKEKEEIKNRMRR